jgi:hypothetical protein
VLSQWRNAFLFMTLDFDRLANQPFGVSIAGIAIKIDMRWRPQFVSHAQLWPVLVRSKHLAGYLLWQGALCPVFSLTSAVQQNLRTNDQPTLMITYSGMRLGIAIDEAPWVIPLNHSARFDDVSASQSFVQWLNELTGLSA